MEKLAKTKAIGIAVIGVVILVFLVVWKMNLSGVKNKDGKVVVTKGEYYVTGCKETLNIYEEANEGGKVLETLSNGEMVELIDKRKGNFWHILYKERKIVGYVEQGYLIEDQSLVSEPSKAYVNAEKGEKVSVISNVDLKTSSIGKVRRGEEVTVLSKQNGDYVKVYSETGNVFGYVEYARLSGGPVVDPSENIDVDRLVGPGEAPEEEYQRFFVDLDVAGYLGLYGKKSEDAKNELAQLDDQEAVYVLDDEGQYWYVYCPKCEMYGYVNADNLTQ